MRLKSIILLAIMLVTSVVAKENYNLLENPDFENGAEGWGLWNGSVVELDTTKVWSAPGESAYLIEGSREEWRGGEQLIKLPKNAVKVVVSAKIKTEGIAHGKKEWNLASVALTWQDDKEKQVGDYPPAVAEVSGTNDWKRYSREYKVLDGATHLLISCQIDKADGKAWFDSLAVIAYDKEGNSLANVADCLLV